MKLYRATGDTAPYFGQWACWTETLEDAEAYTDNPGFGGPAIYEAEVEPEYVLDLTGSDPHYDLAEALCGAENAYEESQEWIACGYAHIWDVWENDPKAAKRLARSYSWVKYEDDYPEGSITWVSLEVHPIPAERVEEETA